MPTSYDNMQPSLAITEAFSLSGIYPAHDGAGQGTPGLLGTIRLFPYNFAPGGTVGTHGQLLSIASNTAVFSLLGTTYGGNGTTNFALPNLDGRLSVDAGQGPGLGNHLLGETYGFANTTLLGAHLPSIVGGSLAPVDNTAPSLPVHYVMNVFGTYNSGTLWDIGMVYQFAGNFAPAGTMECNGQLLLISENDVLFSLIGTTYGGDGVTTFALPDLRGRTIIGADAGGTDIGAVGGSETLNIGTNNLPSDVHFATGEGGGQPLDNDGPTLTMLYIISLEGIYPTHDGGSLDDFTPELGEIIAYAGTTIPDGWAACNGQLLAINQNQALFSLLGTQFGGNGTTNFALPDLRGRAVIGSADGSDVGHVYGTDTILLGLDNIPGMTIDGTPGDDNAISGHDLAGANDADVIRGLGGNDQLTGRGGNDTLNGGTGADKMAGGWGDDTYFVDNVGDLVTENAAAGNDLVISSLNWTLGANLERLSLIGGTAALDGTGNGLANTIIGNNGDNQLSGLDGNDSLDGGAGTDTLLGGNGDDTMNGGTGNDSLDGGIGNDWLNGAAGADVLAGGTGDDTYFVDDSGDVVTEGAAGGTDTVQSSITYILGPNVENLILTGAAAINGFGNSLNNVLSGNSAANVLNGGGGADAMRGGDGSDIYIVDNVGDIVSELPGAGIDLVQASVSYALSANVENLLLTGAAAINGYGNSLNNILTGNSGANILNGGAGNDFMRGGGGNDSYYVDSAGDSILENAGEGTDVVNASVSWTLGANIESLVLTGASSINGTGNGDANTLTGNSGDNQLSGLNGNDTLNGLSGIDTLLGGAGADLLFGGDGKDWLEGGADRDDMTGGTGDDSFVFRDGDFSGTTFATADIVRDFSSAEGDHINLGFVDANSANGGGTNEAFAFIGTGAFTHTAGELRYEEVSGFTYVYGDTNGDGVADFLIRLDGSHALTVGDFVL